MKEKGLFEVELPGDVATLSYHFEAETVAGDTRTIIDPYNTQRFKPWLTDFELHLFGEGRYLYSYDKFGAHRRTDISRAR